MNSFFKIFSFFENSETSFHSWMVRWNDLFFGSKWQEVVYAQNSSKNHKILGISKTCFHRKIYPKTEKWNSFEFAKFCFETETMFLFTNATDAIFASKLRLFCKQILLTHGDWNPQKLIFTIFVADFKQIGWKIWLQKIPQRWL